MILNHWIRWLKGEIASYWESRGRKFRGFLFLGKIGV
jgi:hypothetical protein